MDTEGTLLDPVFVHAGWRTGGTALGYCVRTNPTMELFHEPFSSEIEHLANTSSPQESNDWNSKHPAGMHDHFEEYRRLVEGSGVRGWRPEFLLDDYTSHAQPPESELRAYLSHLVNAAQDVGLRPVFKMETSDARISWLRANFGGYHLGLTRDAEHQYLSWIEQDASNRNPWFFESMRYLVDGNPNLFGQVPLPSQETWGPYSKWKMFKRFHQVTEQLRRKECDATINLNRESSITQLRLVEVLGWAFSLSTEDATKFSSPLEVGTSIRRLSAETFEAVLPIWQHSLETANDEIANRDAALSVEKEHSAALSQKDAELTQDIQTLKHKLEKRTLRLAAMRVEVERIKSSHIRRAARALRGVNSKKPDAT